MRIRHSYIWAAVNLGTRQKMKKSYLSLLTVTIVIASIIIAGCTTSNQVNQGSSSKTSTNASTSLTTTAATSRTATTTSKVTPSPSASPTAATPTPSGKITTTIQFASDPTVAKGGTLFINVLASGFTICGHGAVTATIGTISSEGSSDCFHTAFLDTSGLSQGTHAITLKFSGDSTYQASQLLSLIHISEPTRLLSISYAVFCLKKKKKNIITIKIII